MTSFDWSGTLGSFISICSGAASFSPVNVLASFGSGLVVGLAKPLISSAVESSTAAVVESGLGGSSGTSGPIRESSFINESDVAGS